MDATPASRFTESVGPHLIWGLDLSREGCRELKNCGERSDGPLRWLHFNLANHATRVWISECIDIPKGARELLLSQDTHQRAMVEGDTVACVLHDYERDFETADTARIGALRIAITPKLVVTARQHPLRIADIIRDHLEHDDGIDTPSAVLDLLVSAIVEDLSSTARALTSAVQSAEDAILAGRGSPESRELTSIRRRLAQLHRMLSGMRKLFIRLDEDPDLPQGFAPVIENLVQRLEELDTDVSAAQGEIKLLRDELDLQATNRTNQNLYTLSIITALLMPATLITGIFGMNTGGMPWHDTGAGTIVATLIAGGTAALTYLILKRTGFIQR